MKASQRSIGVLATAFLMPGLLAAGPATTEVYRFRVDLDGRDIGTQVFTIDRTGQEMEVRSVARFDVRLLGVRVFRYQHDATEHWSGGCLVSVSSRTSRNGKPLAVDRKAGDADWSTEACESGFAYWDRSKLERPRLLNPETGKFENVRLDVDASDPGHRRLSAESVKVDLWYSASGHWERLESVTTGGQRLRYRLEEVLD